VYLPIASKLKSRTADEVLSYEMIIEGVMSIQAGDNPRIVETRMMAYLPPAMRAEREKTKVERAREKMAA
jgi:chemotaxis protein MotA